MQKSKIISLHILITSLHSKPRTAELLLRAVLICASWMCEYLMIFERGDTIKVWEGISLISTQDCYICTSVYVCNDLPLYNEMERGLPLTVEYLLVGTVIVTQHQCFLTERDFRLPTIRPGKKNKQTNNNNDV